MMRYVFVFLFTTLSFFLRSVEVVNTIGIKLTSIPAGSYWMGSRGLGEDSDEAPMHKVQISNSFMMSTTEITNAQYEQFDPSHRTLRGKLGFSKEDDEAVIFVNYTDVMAFCNWLSEKEGKIYRLPTEAEWEYACRAGTYFSYSMDDGLPKEYQKNQTIVWTPTPVSLRVKETPANPWGLYDMHGNVEEWCLDWYAPYTPEQQTDPISYAGGLCRVTRGGSHGTPAKFLRSANRMAMLPEDKHWLTGFRIVQAAYPETPSNKVLPKPACMEHVNQKSYKWKRPSTTPFFLEPLVYVQDPGCMSAIPFYRHNHCPAITWCKNGDLLAVWFSTNDEAGREMTVLASRLRVGNKAWDMPSEFFKVPDRNMTGSNLYHDGQGTLIYTNGVETAGSWQNLAIVKRVSTDNGATWSIPELIASEHEMRHQVIAGMIKTHEGWLIQPADASPWGEGGTAIHISKDMGKTWYDPGKGKPADFKAGGTGSTIAGIHAGIVQLKNGDLLAFGRGNSITNEAGLLRMPMSISTDMGESWCYQASVFPPIDGGQRLVLIRLQEGPILFISFTNHPYRKKNHENGIEFIDNKGNKQLGFGMFAAISEDEGKSWQIKKMITDGKERFLDGGAWTGFFEMDATHAEPRGYLAITQTPDHVIHLLSSRLHYRFNLPWLVNNN